MRRLGRIIALVCTIFVVVLVAMAVVSICRPVAWCVSDPESHRHFFLVESGATPASQSDLRQVSTFEGIYGVGSSHECGLIPGVIYWRKSMYVPAQVDRGTYFEDVDETPFLPFDNKLVLGLKYFRVWRNGATSTVFLVPLWIPILLFAIFPLIHFFKRFRQRLVPGCCEKCGYDLRATPQKCPECGTTVKAWDQGAIIQSS